MDDRSHAEIFEKIRRIIADHGGVRAYVITLDTDLVQDLRITGDDGDYILIALNKAFKSTGQDSTPASSSAMKAADYLRRGP